MTKRVFKVICKDKLAVQQFKTLISFFCDAGDFEIIEDTSFTVSPQKLWKVSNARKKRRKKIKARVICTDYESSTKYPIADAIDISQNGICLKIPKTIKAEEKYI
tara:strand:+ start:622 stop:936 length:315 start_codon:yes stop_codon:yes gene_type:complete